MKTAPLILISPCTQPRGVEFSDPSVSLSHLYCEAIIRGGGIPWILPCAPSPALVAESVRRCDGVMLTGGEDVQPQLYQAEVTPKLKRTLGRMEPRRDLLELLLMDEVFRQRKPLLAICRGQQILNVALGGTLVLDIASQIPQALNHNRADRKFRLVHEAALTPDSLLATMMGQTKIRVNSSHHQAIDRLAKLLRATAVSPDGVIEGVELRPDQADWLPFLLAVQFHPERLFGRHPGFLELFRSFVAACNLRAKPAV